MQYTVVEGARLLFEGSVWLIRTVATAHSRHSSQSPQLWGLGGAKRSEGSRAIAQSRIGQRRSSDKAEIGMCLSL